MMQPRAKIIGTGMYIPDRVVTNDDLAKLMDTTDEWIRQRTGIEERRYIEPGQQPADLACAASKRALEAAQLGPEDIDCIVLATLSSQADFPGTSFFLQDQLGRLGDAVLRCPRAVQRISLRALRRQRLHLLGDVPARSRRGVRGSLHGHRPQ